MGQFLILRIFAWYELTVNRVVEVTPHTLMLVVIYTQTINANATLRSTSSVNILWSSILFSCLKCSIAYQVLMGNGLQVIINCVCWLNLQCLRKHTKPHLCKLDILIDAKFDIWLFVCKCASFSEKVYMFRRCTCITSKCFFSEFRKIIYYEIR